MGVTHIPPLLQVLNIRLKIDIFRIRFTYFRYLSKNPKKCLTFGRQRAIIIKLVTEDETETIQRAGVAQLVEQLICNQQVGGSSPSTSSNCIWESSRVAKGGRL